MSKKFTIINVNEAGEITNRNNLKELFTLKKGRYMVEVSGADKRSLQQNKYIHAVLIPEFRKALNSVGYGEVKTDEQAKLVMKSMFLTREFPSETGGKPVHFVQDTSALTKEEMGVLIEEVIAFAAENMNYQIPFPGEILTLDYE